jgi:predicted nucleic acid-binding Zn ribbon protein
MQLLSDLLSKRGSGTANVIDQKTIFFIFQKIIQENFGSLGRYNFLPDYLKEKVLFVKAKNSVWASELWLERKKIINRINGEFGQEVIKDIKLQ